MKPLLCFVLASLLIIARAEPPGQRSVTTDEPRRLSTLAVGGQVFREARVERITAFTARITHATGSATVSAWEFTTEQQRNFGFDTAVVAAERDRLAGLRRKAELFKKEQADAAEKARIEQERVAAAGKMKAKAEAKRLADVKATAESKSIPATGGTLAFRATRPVIGMTEAETRTKYGEPVKEVGNDPPADRGLTFEKNGIYIGVRFFGGRVGQVLYIRKDKRPFLRQEAEVLIENNSNGKKWDYRSDVRKNQNWESEDSGMMAINCDDVGLLSISTREFVEAAERIAANRLKGL